MSDVQQKMIELHKLVKWLQEKYGSSKRPCIIIFFSYFLIIILFLFSYYYTSRDLDITKDAFSLSRLIFLVISI